MRTARFSSSGGEGDLLPPPDADPLWMQTPLEAGHVICDAWCEANPLPCGQNDIQV